jgi:hypothetical protein
MSNLRVYTSNGIASSNNYPSSIATMDFVIATILFAALTSVLMLNVKDRQVNSTL